MIHIYKLDSKRSRKLVRAITNRLNRYPKELRRTITYDNGSENLEHAIGMIKRFLPKKTDFAIIDSHQVR